MLLKKKIEIVNTEWGKSAYISSDNIAGDMEAVKKSNILGVILSFDKGYKLDNVDFLKDYTFIERITISSYQAIDYTALRHLKNLKVLAINVLAKDNQEIDFNMFPKLEDCRFIWRPKAKTIFNCTSLKRLDIIKFNKEDLQDLRHLVNLKTLGLRQSSIKSLIGIENLLLERLGLYHLSKLDNLKGVDKLSKTLKYLDVESCKNIDEIEEISQLYSLEKLGLNNCKEIKSLSPIRGLKKLKWFDFWGNTSIQDGDMTPCIGIQKVAFENRKHYNYKNEEIDKLNQGK
ncbi:hypothetical protein [Penaeicola halotolerans]|uniref:hypothetical protein n=1 Tax=Penaeicola halotolerans TaxID=2793196 RepID=UPI001CF7FD5B|nr:hypothetical protein [Penaeicola halotolerans]